MPIVPDEKDIELLGNLIYPNLENGIVIPEDKVRMLRHYDASGFSPKEAGKGANYEF